MHNAKPDCIALDETLGPQYLECRKLALISHESHLEQLDKEDDSILVVACNWLLWQRARHEGWRCIHTDSVLDGSEMRGLARDVYIRSNDWMYDGDLDLTRFRGVSLGSKFVREISLIILEREYFTHVLENLTDRFAPELVKYFDMFSEFSILDASRREALAAGILVQKNVLIEFCTAPPAIDDPSTPHVSIFVYQRPTLQSWKAKAKAMLNDRLMFLLDWVGRFRIYLGGPKPKTLLLTSHTNGLPLVQKFDAPNAFPIYLAEWLPRRKDLLFWWGRIKSGVIPARLGTMKLGAADAERLDACKRDLAKVWETDRRAENRLVYDYVSRTVIDEGRFERAAAEVCAVEKFLQRHKPSGIFSDSMQNAISTTFLELGNASGIKTFSTWTAHALLTLRQPLIGSDRRQRTIVDQFLSWGKGHEDWLGEIDAKCEAKRTGSMKLASFKGMKPAPSKKTNVLLLQYSVSYYDPCCERSREYAFFVDAIRMLNKNGYKNIRFKLHPGLMLKLGYYKRIAEHFGLTCDFVDKPDLLPQVKWSDFVVGPVHSAAMLEVLASGKAYYPVLLQPSAVDENLLGGFKTFNSVASLDDAIRNEDTPDVSRALEYFTSFGTIEDPVNEVWRTLLKQK